MNCSVQARIFREYQFELTGDMVYFIDQDGNLRQAPLKTGEVSDPITTGVDALHLSSGGRYIFVEKMNALYCYAPESGSWEEIGPFTEDDVLYVTDSDGTLYYITGRTDIPNDYSKKGTLYRYIHGKGSSLIAKDVIYLRMPDAKFHQADTPTIVQYAGIGKRDSKVRLGTVENGVFKILTDVFEDN